MSVDSIVESVKDLARRIGILEDKDRYSDGRMRDVENRMNHVENRLNNSEQLMKVFEQNMKQDRKDIRSSFEKLYDTIKNVEEGHQGQKDLIKDFNYMVDSIKKEREVEIESKKENKKDIKQIKVIVLTAAVSFAFTLIMAMLQQFFF